MSNSVNFTFLQNPEIKCAIDIATAAELCRSSYIVPIVPVPLK